MTQVWQPGAGPGHGRRGGLPRGERQALPAGPGANLTGESAAGAFARRRRARRGSSSCCPGQDEDEPADEGCDIAPEEVSYLLRPLMAWIDDVARDSRTQENTTRRKTESRQDWVGRPASDAMLHKRGRVQGYA